MPSEQTTHLDGTLMLPGAATGRTGSGTVRLVTGRVEMRGGVIVRIDERPNAPLDPGCVVCPGFVDAHLHIPQFDSIGADGLTLLDWLGAVIFPAEMRWADAEHAQAMGDRVGRRLLASGTTAVCAFGTVHHEGTQAAMRALGALGIAGYLGQVLMDREAPTGLVRPAGRLLDEASRLVGAGRMKPIVSPRFAITCTPELMAGAARLAHERGWMLQTHLSEMLPECARVMELFAHRARTGEGGDEYLDVYAEAGMLTDRSVFAHGVWLSEAGRCAIASARAVVAHCPTANTFLRSGAMDLGAMDSAGVRVALGSDIAGGPDVSMVRVARAMLENAKRTREPFVASTPATSTATEKGSIPDAARCWWSITGGNASCLGLADCGRIAVGASADLVVLTPTDGPAAFAPWVGAPDPLAALLYAFDDRWISRTIVQGRVGYSRA